MSLMFDRLARNFAKNGYFPTDQKTLGRIFQAIHAGLGEFALLDPCCGEGLALAAIKEDLEDCEPKPIITTYGVEYNKERAYEAKKVLDMAAHSDIHDMVIKARSMGLLFLNPPYGDMVADKAGLKDAPNGRLRLEKEFFKLSHPWLAFDGVLVLIVPHYVLDKEFSTMIARSYKDVRVFMAPEQQFKQCVIFGIKRKSEAMDKKVFDMLCQVGVGELPPELPANWEVVGDAFPAYRIPQAKEQPAFVSTKISVQELSNELDKLYAQTLWPQFEHHFSIRLETRRAPLRKLSDWHLALALAAGQISGVVKSKLGRILLVKGDTFKEKTVRVTLEEADKDGNQAEVRTSTDRFVPVIRAIDFTPGMLYGHLVSIT